MAQIVKAKKTKKQKAIELYEENYTLPNDKIIRLFIKELDLPSENSARTYISMAKKSLSSKLGIKFNSRKVDSRKTKKGRAMEIFNKNPSLTRKEMVDIFMKKLDMTEGSASAHCSFCSKEYSGPKHKAIS